VLKKKNTLKKKQQRGSFFLYSIRNTKKNNKSVFLSFSFYHYFPIFLVHKKENSVGFFLVYRNFINKTKTKKSGYLSFFTFALIIYPQKKILTGLVFL